MCVFGREVLCITKSTISLWSTIWKTTLVKEQINYIFSYNFLNAASLCLLYTNSLSPCKYEVKVGEFRSRLGGSWKAGLLCLWPLWILIRFPALIAQQPSFIRVYPWPQPALAFAVGRKEKLGFRNESTGPQINWKKRDNISVHRKGG